MKSKMWNKIFHKNKSKIPSDYDHGDHDGRLEDITTPFGDRITTHESFVPITTATVPYNELNLKLKSTLNSIEPTSMSGECSKTSNVSASNSKSKLSKMVNSLSLKRNSSKNKENKNYSYNNSDIAISIIRNESERNNYNGCSSNGLNNKTYNTDENNSLVDRNNKNINFNENIASNLLIFDETPVSSRKADMTDQIDSFQMTEPISLELVRCPICNRTFVPATLEKHVGICEKMATTKRKIFDSSRQRCEGTDFVSFSSADHNSTALGRQNSVERKPTGKTTPVVTERRTSTDSQFQRQTSLTRSQRKSVSPVLSAAERQQIKDRVAAKRAQPPAADRCPHCERNFGYKAYDRHVEWCKEKARINAIKNPNGVTVAKERLEARTKYKAPNIKLKRNQIRDKYSGFDDGRSEDNFLSMSTSLSSSFMSDGASECKSLSDNNLNNNQNRNKTEVSLKKSAILSNERKNVSANKSERNIQQTKNFEVDFSYDDINDNSNEDCKLVNNTQDIIKIDKSGQILKEIMVPLSPKIKTRKPRKMNNFEENHVEKPTNILPIIKPPENIKIKLKKKIKSKLPQIERNNRISNNDVKKLLHTSKMICDLKQEPSYEIDLDSINKNYETNTNLVYECTKNFWLDLSKNSKQKSGNSQQQCKNKSGFSDKYDPFLSAKRQLEELCSPTTSADKQFDRTTRIISPITTPTTPKPPSNSSLITSAYTSGSNAANPRNTLNTVKSNFRRTSSLRSPKKSTPCIRPLFVPPSRLSRPTTVQRGISDEGPISTNFLKPEEFDEMPVKSACVNNYAVGVNSPKFMKRDPSPKFTRETSPKIPAREPSPLVIKRDANTNLNRRNLRLNLKEENSSNPSIPVNKTDSLAVFLKYENELAKLGNAENLNPNRESPELGTLFEKSGTTTKSSSSSTVISEKELKDKTNILSKQNSLKNSSSDLVEKTFGSNDKEKITSIKNSLNNLLEANKHALECLTVNKILPLKLDPLPSNTTAKYSLSEHLSHNPLNTPIQNPPKNNIKSQLTSQLQASLPIYPVSASSTLFPSSQIQPFRPPLIQPICLDSKKSQKPSHQSFFSTTLAPLFPDANKPDIKSNRIKNNDSKDSDNFIDPKLINKCDNLSIVSKFSDSDLASSSSQDSAQTTKEIPNKYLTSTPNNLETLKFNDEKNLTTGNLSNRSSAEKKNLLKRQLRLGRNQFLFDASPSDGESSPNSTTNNNPNTFLPSIIPPDEKEFDSLLSPSENPIFNNFDFEEFLSTFENSNDDDDDQFPGFKDCKEFLLSRTRNIRSRMQTNNTPIHSNRLQKYGLNQSEMLGETNSDDDRKREIFISIETNDQNDNATIINPCPQNPDLIQNPKVEEVNLTNDNKFTKIETYHLPVFEEEKDESLINSFVDDVLLVKRNNIKNKLEGNIRKSEKHEKEDDDIMNKTCESATSMYPADSDEISSVECFPIERRNQKSKASADSAYGSLSRHSPTSTDRSSINRNSSGRTRLPSTTSEQSSMLFNSTSVQQQRNRNRELSGSSSSSENSLPPINGHKIQAQMSLGDNGNNSQKMSKFCHECGSKFLVETAKFCMECGVKRIIL